MSQKKLWLRLSEKDLSSLDAVMDAMGAQTRSAAVRFLIRQWTAERNDWRFATQAPTGPIPP